MRPHSSTSRSPPSRATAGACSRSTSDRRHAAPVRAHGPLVVRPRGTAAAGRGPGAHARARPADGPGRRGRVARRRARRRRDLPVEPPARRPRAAVRRRRRAGAPGAERVAPIPADRTLFCQYELFGYAGSGLAGISRVRGGYAITDEAGRTVAGEAPSAITTDGSRVVRRLALPLTSLPPGRYTLTLQVEDQLAGRTFTAREAFEVEAPPLVPADDRRVRITGRVDHSRAGRVRIGYPGVALHLRFEAPSLAMRADATTPDVYFDVAVDGGPPRVLAFPAAPADAALAQGLSPGAHTLELVHRNETWQGVVAVIGFLTDAEAPARARRAAVAAPPVRRRLRDVRRERRPRGGCVPQGRVALERGGVVRDAARARAGGRGAPRLLRRPRADARLAGTHDVRTRRASSTSRCPRTAVPPGTTPPGRRT